MTDSEILDWLEENAYVEAGPNRDDWWAGRGIDKSEEHETLREYVDRVANRGTK